MSKFMTVRGGAGDVTVPENARPQDNLYLAVNAEYLKNAEIPADKPATGSFNVLAENVEKALMAEFAAFASGEKETPAGTEFQNAVELYRQALDFEQRNADGAKPIQGALQKLADLKDFADFNKKAADFSLNGFAVPVDFGVDTDMKDTKHHVLATSGPSIFLQDTTQYGTEAGDKLLKVFESQSENLLQLAGLSAEEAAQYVSAALKFDAKVAKIVKSNEEWADYPASYNPYDFDDFAKYFKSFDVTGFVQQIVGKVPERVIEADPRFLENAESLVNEANFAEIKGWMFVKFINGVTNSLSHEFRDAGFPYRQAMFGVKELADPEKNAYQTANGLFDEVVGIYYGKKYLGDDAKADVISMIHKMISIYEQRLSNNDWLSQATKDKAKVKLQAMVLKVGYPDKIEEIYSRYQIKPTSEGGSLYENLHAARLEQIKYNLEKLDQDVDRTTWNMPGNLVNASYDPSKNDLTFPAAILQAPFYDLQASSSTNYGGIGAVIAHEISHAFDNNGAQFDEFGNMVNWWTDEDFKQFKTRTQAEIDLFDGIEYGGGKINGKLVVSENVADVGGLSNAIEAAKSEADANMKELFENWARVWAMKASPEYINMLLAVDVHAPGPMRANVQPQNFAEFYEAFDVQPEDGMYLEPEKRVNIW